MSVRVPPVAAAALLTCLTVFLWLHAATVHEVADRTLVLYSFSDTDPAYRDNLRYFVRAGLAPGDPGVDAVVVLNGAVGDVALPKLPRNAQYLAHDNVCYDWGSYGWAMDRLGLWRGYSRYVFVNSSVRGPFVPAYARARRWTDALAGRLSARVKLVGPTVSCESPSGRPHVQSYVVATDAVGLQVLRDAGVFRCRGTLDEVIQGSEVEASRAVMDAGFDIDCLMHRYQGVDWHDRANWGCNRGVNPTKAHGNAGAFVSPMEVMFVKVKARFLRPFGWPNAVDAAKYDAVPAVRDGARVDVEVRARCFDLPHYLASNPDLPRGWGMRQAYAHFLRSGMQEGRMARYKRAC